MNLVLLLPLAVPFGCLALVSLALGAPSFERDAPGQGWSRESVAVAGVARMPSTDTSPSVIVEQLTRALGEAVIRTWSTLPQEVQDHLFKEAVASQGEAIRSQLAVFLHDRHPRTSDPLGNPREMKEPDSLGG